MPAPQPGQTPQTPAPAPYPAYGYPPGVGVPISKRLVFTIVAFGAFLIWIAQVAIWGFRPLDTGILSGLRALFITGSAIGFGGALLGALGSPRMDGYQRLGLLVLASVFLFVLAQRF